MAEQHTSRVGGFSKEKHKEPSRIRMSGEQRMLQGLAEVMPLLKSLKYCYVIELHAYAFVIKKFGT